MKQTQNYNIPYPENDDYFDVEDFQNMMIAVDALVQEVSDSDTQMHNDTIQLCNQIRAQLNTIQKRMNAFTTLNDGSTKGDAELKDIRVTYDGKERENAGAAVRSQIAELHKLLTGARDAEWSKEFRITSLDTENGSGIDILNEQFAEAGIVTTIDRGVPENINEELSLETECNLYIVKFDRLPGTQYVPSVDNISIVATHKIKFDKTGIAQCWIPVEKGQYLGIDGIAVAHDPSWLPGSDYSVPYMEYDAEKNTLEYYGFNPNGQVTSEYCGALDLAYKLEYPSNDYGMLGRIMKIEEDIKNIKNGTGGDTKEYYSVKLDMSNCTSSNKNRSVEKGSAYTTTITADSGYKMSTVECTMGGVSQPVQNGTVNIVSATGDIVVRATAAQIIEKPCTGIKLAPAKTLFKRLGITDKVTATLTPTDTTDKLTWESSDNKVATVTENGVVKSISEGKATIIAKCGTQRATCSIEVAVSSEGIACTNISLDQTTLEFDKFSKTKHLTAILIPADTTDEVKWASMDENVATVLNGLVVSTGKGTTRIVAECGNQTAACSVTVTEETSEFRTATELVNDITVGWNLGNTFDATSSTVRASAKNRTSNEGTDYEAMWPETPVTTKEMFVAVRDKGFNAVRIPVTWNHHIVDKNQTGNNISIAPAFLNRVKEVVNWAYDLGMIVFLNTHHDTADYSKSFSSVTAAGGGSDAITWKTEVPFQLFALGNTSPTNAETCEYMKKLWTVIAKEFESYGDRLVFEGFNEILDKGRNWSAATADQLKWVNNLNNAFVSAVRATGGNNAKRVLSCQSYAAYIDSNSVSNFSVNDTVKDKIIFQGHYYTDDNDSVLLKDFAALDTLKYPIVLGEIAWDINRANVKDDMYNFARNYVSYARQKEIKCFWWDINLHGLAVQNFGLLNRDTVTWARPYTVQGLIDGVTMDPVDIVYTTDYKVKASDVCSGKLYTKADITDSSIYPGQIGEQSAYGAVVLTMTISGEEGIDIQVGNNTITVDGTIMADPNAFKLKRYVFLDENKKAIVSDLISGANNISLAPPIGAKYIRVGCVQVYTPAITSDMIKNAITAGTAWITVKSNNTMTVDTTNFVPTAPDPISTENLMQYTDFAQGPLVTGSESVTGYSTGQISSARTYGTVTAGFKGFNEGDTLEVLIQTPGFGNSNFVARINRHVWYNDAGVVVESERIGSDPPYDVVFTCPAGASVLRFTAAHPWDQGNVNSQKMLDLIQSGAITVQATPSADNIVKMTSTEVTKVND